MFQHLWSQASIRRLRLFACAWCRYHCFEQLERRWQDIVQVGESFADGLVRETKRHLADQAALWAMFAATRKRDWENLRAIGEARKTVATAKDQIVCIKQYYSVLEKQRRCEIIRCIFGNPFRPITLDPSWITPSVKTLAQSIYDNRTFDRLPLLADELEKAGCDNQEILDHCRGVGEHVRGCWVVDLVLRKG